MGNIFLSGQNKCHITKVKKSYFCHTFHLRPKKVFWRVGGGGGWKVTLVSVCVHFLKLLDTQTQKWTQSLTKNVWSLWSKNTFGYKFLCKNSVFIARYLISINKKDPYCTMLIYFHSYNFVLRNNVKLYYFIAT